MKRTYLILIAIFLCALLCLAFSSCGGGTPEGDDTENSEHTHIYGGWTTTREATCTQEGERKQVCTCGDFKTESIPTIAHTLVDVEGSAPTCEKPGCTPGKNCSVCDTIIVAQKIIPPTGHEEKILPRKEPTCKETGLTEGKGCANCDVVITNQEIIPIVSCNIVDGFCTMCKVSYVIDGLLFAISEDNTYAILTDVGECTDSVIYIPATYQNLPVKKIGAEAFADTGSATEVHLPNTVEIIDERAFINCQGLTSVTIPNSITSIGSSAFNGCTGLEEITVPFVGNGSDQTHFGYIFGADLSLDNGDYVPTSLKKVAITGEGIIGEYAFVNCTGITNVTIASGITSIGTSAFMWCTGLRGITIGSNVTTIGEHAFDGCVQLADVTLGNNVTTIDKYAFFNCKKIANIEIPNSVTKIGESAFYDCEELASLTIGNSVGKIEKSAFMFCTSLIDVYISDVACWCSISFEDASANPLYYAKNLYLNNTLVKSLVIPSNITTIKSYAFYEYKHLTDIVISNTVTAIDTHAFYRCISLTSVEIPNSVTSIGSAAFDGCTGLTSIIVDEGNPSYKSIDGNLYSKDEKTLVQYAIGKKDTSFVIPNGVTSIGEYAFSDCTGLTSVTIPNSVTSIGSYAFEYCKGLTSITIPSSVTTIGSSAFNNCTGLTSVTIPNSVTTIGSYAFYDCSNLTIYCEATSKPSGWSSSWNYANRPVVWDYKNK